MVTTPIFLLPENRGYSLRQFEYDYLNDAIERLVHSGICPPEQARAVAVKAIHRVEAKYVGENTLKLSIIWNAFLTFASQEMQTLQKMMDQNFGLTEEEFHKMTAALEAGDKSMFELVFLNHFASCRDYLIRTYRAAPEDAYDATMDTLMEFYHRMVAGKIQYGNLRYLFTKMGSQIYMKSHKKWNVFSMFQQESDVQMVDDVHEEETDQVLNKAWEKLGDGCQHLLKAFYYDNKTLNILAAEMGKDPAAMRKQKQRCVEALRSCFIRFSSI